MGTEIYDAFKTAFRKYQVDGVPSSGNNAPKKAEIIAAGQVVQDVVDGVADGMSGFTADVAELTEKIDQLEAGQGKGSIVAVTEADLIALAAAIGLNNTDDRGRLMSVYADPDPTKNGDYQWSGTAPVFLGSGRIGKLESAVSAPLAMFGSSPLIWDYDGFAGTVQTLYVPRFIYARRGATVMSGNYGTESSEFAGYVKLALGDTDHSSIYIDMDDGTNPYKVANNPTLPTTARPDKIIIVAEVWGRVIKTDQACISLEKPLRDRVHFRDGLVKEGSKLLVSKLIYRRRGNSSVQYSPSDGSDFWELDMSLTSGTVFNHLFSKTLAEAGSVPVYNSSPATPGSTQGPDYILVEFASTLNGFIQTEHQKRVRVPNMYARGRDPDNSQRFNGTVVGDITGSNILALGFTRGVTGANQFLAGTLPADVPKKGYYFFRYLVQADSTGAFPTSQGIYLKNGGIAIEARSGRIEKVLSSSERIMYGYGSYDYTVRPDSFLIGGFDVTGVTDGFVTGAQVWLGNEPAPWIARDDWPDMLEDGLIVGPDLWTVTGRTFSIFVEGVSQNRYNSETATLTIDSLDESDFSKPPLIIEGSAAAKIDPATLKPLVNITLRDRTGAPLRQVASMNLHKAPATAAGTPTPKILNMGDSTTYHGSGTILKTKLADMGINATMLGTLREIVNGVNGEYSEGRRGWKWIDWTHDDATHPLPASSAAYIAASDTSAAAGSRQDMNPWINPSTGNFDPSYFFTTYGIAAPNYILFNLGTNDERNVADAAALLTQVSAAFDKIIPPLLSYLPSVKMGIWMPNRPEAWEANYNWSTMRKQNIELLIAKRNALAAAARVDIVPTWIHQSAISGWEMTPARPAPASGPTFTYVDDDLHQRGVNYSLIGESHAAWIACKIAGV